LGHQETGDESDRSCYPAESIAARRGEEIASQNGYFLFGK
jgi:hypothetical protein